MALIRLSEHDFHFHIDLENIYQYDYYDLLPTGSEERGILEVGSVPVAMLPTCQYNYCIITLP